MYNLITPENKNFGIALSWEVDLLFYCCQHILPGYTLGSLPNMTWATRNPRLEEPQPHGFVVLWLT